MLIVFWKAIHPRLRQQKWFSQTLFSGQKVFQETRHLVACGKMGKVWEELKKIEAEAEKIRSGAQQKAQSITALAQQNSEKLVANSQTYAQGEGQQLYAGTVAEANRKRDEQLKASIAANEKLKVEAGKRMELAVNTVVKAIIKGS
jgi:vacuolar-type H+-ATPase subunit H